MQKQRVKITLAFEADLDMIPGWGHEPKDWVAYVENCLSGNQHYHPTTQIVNVETIVDQRPTPTCRICGEEGHSWQRCGND